MLVIGIVWCPSYKQKRQSWKLDKGTIDAYLDAKAENDYLEIRGVKLVVATEMIKSVFLKSPNSNTSEHIINPNEFEKLQFDICVAVDSALQKTEIDKNSRKAIATIDKIKSLNRRSFGHILRKLCKHIGLKAQKDIDYFIKCRNSLVHIGNFFCKTASPEEQAEVKHKTQIEEYLFLLNFLDKLFLSLLGYEGPYIDRQIPNKPDRRERVNES